MDDRSYRFVLLAVVKRWVRELAKVKFRYVSSLTDVIHNEYMDAELASIANIVVGFKHYVETARERDDFTVFPEGMSLVNLCATSEWSKIEANAERSEEGKYYWAHHFYKACTSSYKGDSLELGSYAHLRAFKIKLKAQFDSLIITGRNEFDEEERDPLIGPLFEDVKKLRGKDGMLTQSTLEFIESMSAGFNEKRHTRFQLRRWPPLCRFSFLQAF